MKTYEELRGEQEQRSDRRQAGQGADADREQIADRLLRSTAARGYDPEVDIDWSAPFEDGKHFVLPHRCSLYGTDLWEQLTPEQRIELGKHEIASVASAGIFLELVLMRMLARLSYWRDPLSRHVQYALAELGEETRHTTMFAMMIERLGTPCYLPSPTIRRLGDMLATTAHGPSLWGAVLLGEEVTDRLQREYVNDPSMQPLIQMVSKIHILEEARHVSFARAELIRSVEKLPKIELPVQRSVIAKVAFVVSRILVNPQVYAAVGLDPRQARRVALANPHYRESLKFAGEKVVAFLNDAGMIGHPGMIWWRRSFLLS